MNSNLFAKWVPVVTAAISLLFGSIPLLGAGKNFDWYEGASVVRFNKIKAGPNTFSITAVVRNHRDGTLSAEDGRGHPVPVPREGLDPSLTRCASWMDEVQIFLQPGPALMEAMSIWVFDPKTGRPFAAVSPFYTTNGGVLLRATTPLPEKLDLWFHTRSYSPKDPVYRLPCALGASIQAGAGTLKVMELKPPDTTKKNMPRHFYYKIMGQGMRDLGRGQICTVTKQGTKAWPYSSVAFNNDGDFMDSDYTHLDFSEISYFEIRPFGGSHKFYFPAVKLPPCSGGVLSAPPPIVMEIHGHEVDVTNNDLVPIRIRTFKGVRENELSAHTAYCSVTLGEPRDGSDDRSTLVYDCNEMRFETPSVKGVDLLGQPLELDGETRLPGGSVSISSAMVGDGVLNCPLTNIGSLTIQFKAFGH